MEENKITETETEAIEVAEDTENKIEKIEVAEDAEIKSETAAEEKIKDKKPKRIRNQAFWRKGSYSVAITAIFLAGIIVLNILVGVLSKRVMLEYDFSSDKKSSLSADNIDYVKNVKKDVSIVFCTSEDTYSDYMSYYAQQYNVTSSASEYYDQTIKIVNKYADYNSKIDLQYIDPQSADFTKISSEYPNDKLSYGDIIVSAKNGNNTRYKIVKYTDIYSLTDDDTYAAYGYTTSAVTGNNIENALTGAISYVLSDKTVKVAFLTGHSAADITADYKTLLNDNNYEIETVSDKVINKISSEYDSVIIAAPTTDFLEGEIKALSEFLDNDSKLGKGIIVFADAATPYLSNLYNFLEDWGIAIEDGVVLETDEDNYIPDEPTTLGSYGTGDDDITADMRICITGENVPVTASFDKREDITVTSLTATPETAIAAPKGSGAGFADAGSYEKKSYSTCIMSEKLDYLDGTKEATSRIFVFSSTYFLTSEYNESSSVSNKNLSLAVTERACGNDKSEISFVTKSIENESFADDVTQSSSNLIVLFFVILLPLTLIIAGIFIFIKRRNS